MKSRKLIFSIVGLVILCGAFVLMVIKGAMSDMMFTSWLAGILGLVGIYTSGNVLTKKYKNGKN